MVLFLLLVIAAIALGIVGVVVNGLFWLLIIGIVVILVDLIVVGVRMGRRRRVTATPADPLTIPLGLPGIRSRGSADLRGQFRRPRADPQAERGLQAGRRVHV